MRKIPNINTHIFKQPDLPWSVVSEGWNDSDITAFAKSTTEISFNFDNVLADSYDYEVADDSGFSNVVQSANVANNDQVDLTTLTIDTQYWIRVKANKTGFDSSDWVSADATTLPVVPLHFYNLNGLYRDTVNQFGRSGSPVQVTQVDEIYSFMGTANTLTNVGTLGRVLVHDDVIQNNKRSSYPVFNNNAEYSFASQVSITGDFTIIFQSSVIGGSFLNIITNNAATDYIRVRSANCWINIGGSIFAVTWLETPPSQEEVIYVFKRVGSVFYISSDGGENYASVTANSNTLTFDKILPTSSVFRVAKFAIIESDLTFAQIKRYSEIEKLPDATVPTKITTPKGLTFSSLSTDYFIDSRLVAECTAALYRQTLYTRGDYSYMVVSKSDTFGVPKDGLILVYKHSTGEISEGLSTGIPSERKVDDSHDDGSIFLTNNNLYHTMASDHYDNGVWSSLILKKSGKDLNFSALSQLKKANEFVIGIAGLTQYHQYVRSTNYDCIICQEWNPSGFAEWVTLYRSKDGFNSFDKIRIASCEANPNWFYHRVVYSEDGTIRLLLNNLDSSSRHKGVLYIKSTDDGETWTSLDGISFSKNIVDNNASMTLTELIAVPNVLAIDGSAKIYSTSVFRAFHDPTDDEVYMIVNNGDADGLNLIYSSSGSWVSKAVDFGGKNIVVGSFTDDPLYANQGRNVPFAVRTGTNEYHLYCQEVIGSPTNLNDNLRIIELKTLNKGVTWSFVQNISTDDTKVHFRMEVSTNLHYTGGTTAYDGNRLLIGSRNNALTGATGSDVFIKDIS